MMCPEIMDIPDDLRGKIEWVEPSPPSHGLSYDEIKNSLIPFLKKLPKDPILIVINDAHRSTPSHVILKIILENNVNIGLIAIATGSHSQPNKDEIETIFQDIDISSLPIHYHNGSLPISEYLNLGKTKRGTKVFINPIVNEFQTILTINSVEPHYFAGFTGGIKSVVPGLASVKTIEKNHAWALSNDSGPTLTNGNPVFEDLWECGSKIQSSILGIQLVNIGSRIFGIFCGNLREAFEKAKSLSSKIFVKSFSTQFDLVISHVIGPISRSLYQAQKGLENTRQVLKKGGTIVLVAECKKGIGNTAFFETLSKYDNPSDVVNSISIENYRFGDHKAAKFASLALYANLRICSSLSEETIHSVFAEKILATDLSSLIRKFVEEGKSVLYVHDSGNVVVTIN